MEASLGHALRIKNNNNSNTSIVPKFMWYEY